MAILVRVLELFAPGPAGLGEGGRAQKKAWGWVGGWVAFFCAFFLPFFLNS